MTTSGNKADRITRSRGVDLGTYGVAGGGWFGVTPTLDDAVFQAALALRDTFDHPVTIRFDGDRVRGGAWLQTSTVDAIGLNAEVGITYSARIVGLGGQELLDVDSDPDVVRRAWKRQTVIGVSRPEVHLSAIASRSGYSVRETTPGLSESISLLKSSALGMGRGALIADRIAEEARAGMRRVALPLPSGDTQDATFTPIEGLGGDIQRYVVSTPNGPIGIAVAGPSGWSSAVRSGGAATTSIRSSLDVVTFLLGL